MSVLRRSAARPTLEARVRDEIERLRPTIGIASCIIEIARLDASAGALYLRVEGDCPDCEMSAATLMRGIEAHLRARLPEIRQVHRANESDT